MSNTKVVIIGKKRIFDYVGARSIYLYRTLSDYNIESCVWDYEMRNEDLPLDASHVIWLPWIQDLSQTWLRILSSIDGKKILWTENHNWYDNCRAMIKSKGEFDPDVVFSRVATSSLEGAVWWGPTTKFEYWGSLVHESVVLPSDVNDTIFIDWLWPYEWDDKTNARGMISDIAQRIKNELRVKLITQPDHDGNVPEWADDSLKQGTPHETFIDVISRCQAYVTTHHELLGLNQAEALMAGVPVVVASQQTCSTITAVNEGVFTYSIDKAKEEPNETGDKLFNAIVKAAQASTSTDIRQDIRSKAIERFGKENWWNKVGSRIFIDTKPKKTLDVNAILNQQS